LNFNLTLNMNIDYSELERGFNEELKTLPVEKRAFWPALAGATALATTGVPWLVSKIAPETHKSWSENPNNTLYNMGTATNNATKAVDTGLAGFNKLVNEAPNIIDNIGKFAPLAMGALMLPSLMNKGQGQQGGNGQPVVVNNYMGQKPNVLTPQQGVNSLSNPKIAKLLDKKADMITEALTAAAKRRIANRVLDVVSPEEKNEVQQSPEELEIVTKYPEMAKLLEDEENKAYLGRLLQH